MGGQITKAKEVTTEISRLETQQKDTGIEFPGSGFHASSPNQRKEWMSTLDLDQMTVKNVLWPGTHDSATNKIGIPFISRPFAQCQTLSIYDQLCLGVRVLDIRVEGTGRVCHGILTGYKVDVVIDDIKRFLSETTAEVIILEIRTEYQRPDPPDFDKFLITQFGDYLVPQDPSTFDKTIRQLLPHRLICVWKPANVPGPSPGSPLWSKEYLKDNWIDTDMPAKKFDSNLSFLANQEPNAVRRYFYRVENTATPQVTSVVLCVWPVTTRIRGFARLFVAECNKQGILDRLQIFSSDFIEDDFIDLCVGVTMERLRA